MRSSNIVRGLIAVVVLAAGCSSGEQSAEHTVVYEATGKGTASALVYIEKPGEMPKTQQSPTLPWTKELKAKKGDFLSLNVVAEPDVDVESGEIGGAEMTCRITVDGKEVVGKSDTFTALCDVTVP